MRKNIKKIGIIGGGQLGMMMAEAAHKLGYTTIVLDPTPNCSCAQVSKNQIVANYNDLEKLEELCKESDVITYEFENVPYTVIEHLKTKYNIPQGELPLYLSQDRLREKQAAVQAGAKVAKHRSVTSKKELENALDELGYPAVLKTCSGGYDGKGQVVIRSYEQMNEACELVKSTPCILEQIINFDLEISIVVTRGIRKGKGLTTFPVTQNIHRNNILYMSIAPAPINKNLQSKIETLAKKITKNMGIIGTLAFEFFVTGHEVIFNEMAPRPHNSGHYTIEGCETSQFEQHIRAITGMPLGKTDLLQPTIMVNYLGQHVEGIAQMKKMKLPNTFIHDYGKAKALKNRKMGHVTFVEYEKSILENIIKRYW
jgi:5-(carboxyamino)imidazole ribonucleotide synthase